MPNSPEGKQITIDSKVGKLLGFTSDRFSLDSYLWMFVDTIWISLIFSKDEGQGNFKKLIKRILKLGYKVIVPTPSNRMRSILKKWEFTESFDSTNGCEIWIKEGKDARL